MDWQSGITDLAGLGPAIALIMVALMVTFILVLAE